MRSLLAVALITCFSLGMPVPLCAEGATTPKPQPATASQGPGISPATSLKAEGAEVQRSRSDAEFNTLMMRSTFMLCGNSKKTPGKISLGAGFLVRHPLAKESGLPRLVLITAAHVIEDFQGPTATMVLRRQNADGSYQKAPHEFQILDASQKPLWVHHSDEGVDVAAIYVNVPSDLRRSAISTPLLGGDAVLEKYEIHPGDELSCLGFPLGVQSPLGGFPILRSGKIASYPLVPAKTVKQFFYDFQIYEGNSGGPVYFIQTNRFYAGTHHMGETIHFVAGLVSAQALAKLHNNEPVYLAVVIPAQFILETTNLLPFGKE